MPTKRAYSYLAILVLTLLLLTPAACSDSSNSEETQNKPPSNSNTGNYETCEGFLTAKHVEDESGISGLTEQINALDLVGIAGLGDSGATANCQIDVFLVQEDTDKPAPGDSVTLTVVQFENEELAASMYESTLSAAKLTAEQVGDLVELSEEVLGTNSHLMDMKAGGIGAIVAYAYGATFISISSTADDQANALLDGQTLVNAAQGVQSRLP